MKIFPPPPLLTDRIALFPVSRLHLEEKKSSKSLSLPPSAGLLALLQLPWKLCTSVLALHQLDSKLKSIIVSQAKQSCGGHSLIH